MTSQFRKDLNFSKNYTKAELNSSGIYAIINKLNSKFYIGSAKNFSLRLSAHLNDLKNKDHHSIYLQRSVFKNGISNFEFRILEFVEEEYLIDIEQAYLSSTNCEYNVTPIAGSTLGYKHSKKTRQLMSENSGRAVKFTIFSPSGDKFEGKNLAKFCASRDLECKYISEVLKGKKFQYKGWTSSLENYKDYKYKYRRRLNQIKIHKFINPEGVLIETYSLHALVTNFGLDDKSLYMLYKGVYKHHKGWTLVKEDE